MTRSSEMPKDDLLKGMEMLYLQRPKSDGNFRLPAEMKMAMNFRWVTRDWLDQFCKWTFKQPSQHSC